MASGERERTGFASGSPTGPISSGQKLRRCRQVRSPPLPRSTHGHPAAPFPRHGSTRTRALLELTGLVPGGQCSSHTLEGCNPLTETREPLPSTFPPSVHFLLQRIADISPGSQRESERKGDLGRWAHLGGSRLAQPGTDLGWLLLAGRETRGPPLTPQWEAAHQSDTWLGAKQDGNAIRGLYCIFQAGRQSDGGIRAKTAWQGMSCAESKRIFQQKEDEAQGRSQPGGFEEHLGGDSRT